MRRVVVLIGLLGLGQVGACGGDGGGDDGGSAGGTGGGSGVQALEPSDVFDEQVRFFQQLCACEEGAPENVPENAPCVLANADPPALRACKEQALEPRWTELRAAGQCHFQAYQDGIACLEAMSECATVGECLVEFNAASAACPDAFEEATSGC